MGIDAQSNVYVTGTAGTRKYTAAGALVWANISLKGNDLKVLPGGTSYLASSNGGDALTIKLDSAGNVLWQRTYNGPANQSDTATLVEVDSLGFVFVAGYQDSTHDGESTNFMLLMYNSTGALQWGAGYNGARSKNDLVLGLAVDSLGKPVVTGWSNVPMFYGDGDISTVKFNRSGVKLWDRTFDGEDGIHDRPSALVIDRNDNVIVTGSSESFAKSSDYVTLKYSSSGDPLWGEFFDGGASSFDQATAIAVDAQGYIYVTGGCYRQSGIPQDFATLKYSPTGGLVWKKFYDSPFADGDAATHMTLDRWNSVVVVGESWGADSQIDISAVKYLQVTDSPTK